MFVATGDSTLPTKFIRAKSTFHMVATLSALDSCTAKRAKRYVFAHIFSPAINLTLKISLARCEIPMPFGFTLKTNISIAFWALYITIFHCFSFSYSVTIWLWTETVQGVTFFLLFLSERLKLIDYFTVVFK